MFIEDIIDAIENKHWHNQIFSHKDSQFLQSINMQVKWYNRPLTKKQADLALLILKRNLPAASAILGKDISLFLNNPQYKHPLRVISPDKTVKIIINDRKQRVIKVGFPYDEGLVNLIKAYKNSQFKKENHTPAIDWNLETRTWDFSCTEDHIHWISNNLIGFEFDNEFAGYVKDIEKVQQNLEKYAPMVVYEDERFIYKNAHKNIPQPSSDDLLEVLFQAKEHGITIWDDAINFALESNKIDPVVSMFLKHVKSDPLVLPNDIVDLKHLEDILKYSKNVVFVIPGGTELLHLKIVHSWLKACGYQEDEMTVMFRLDSSSGKICNEYIKQHRLNTPLTDRVRFVFISGKVPKPLIAANKKCDLIIHFGTNSAHYTLKNFILNHHAVISMSIVDKNKGFNFA